MKDRDAIFFQDSGVADARELEELGGLEYSRADDDLAFGGSSESFVVCDEGDTGGVQSLLLGIEVDFCCLSVYDNVQIRTRRVGLPVGVG